MLKQRLYKLKEFKMVYYIKLGNVRGISIELNLDLGIKPFFEKNSFHHETIIDIPCVQIIYTSGRWRKKIRVPIRRVANGNKQNGQVKKSPKRVNSS